MPDRRDTPDPAVARRSDPASISVPVADLLSAPDGARDRQLLLGEAVTVLGDRDGRVYLRAEKDGYHGYVDPQAVTAAISPTHKVCDRATHCYEAPDLKSRDIQSLSYGSKVVGVSETDEYVETSHGFIPKTHLNDIDELDQDPVRVVGLFARTPYLWGGNSSFGIDCSGLIQASLLACGIPCPGDSDQQMEQVGSHVPDGTRPQPGDLFFWKGHVAMIARGGMIYHANAFHMGTYNERIERAVDRIESTGGGPLLAHKRL